MSRDALEQVPETLISLAELLDHRNLNVTRAYYRVGEERRRDAVDKVTAMSFDRHGNRAWRDEPEESRGLSE